MKKKLSKNYIAFTLTEMTMVLLIMSVIAAVSAPLVKHAVSDVTNNSEPTKRGGIWRKINNLDGIFYSSVGNGMVSVNYIPTADPINYGYPTMIINHERGASYFLKKLNRQIGFYSSYLISSSSSTIYPSSFGLNSKQGIFLQTAVKEYDSPLAYDRVRGYGRITMGRVIGADGNADDILIGYSRGSKELYATNAVAISADSTFSGCSANINDSVMLGDFCDYIPTSAYFIQSVGIGMNGYPNYRDDSAIGDRNIDIGSSSGVLSYSNNSVNIGAYTGYGIYSGLSTANINIGKFSGLISAKTGDTIAYGNINIGKSAGISKYYSGIQRTNNIAIGLGTLSTAESKDYDNPVLYASYANNEVVAIGAYAAVNRYSIDRSVFIGNKAAASRYIVGSSHDDFKDDEDSLVIGNYAEVGYNGLRFSTIIGNHTTTGSIIQESVLIGNYATAPKKVRWRYTAIGNYVGRANGAVASAPVGSTFIGNYAANHNYNDCSLIIGNFPYDSHKIMTGVKTPIYLYAGSNYYGRDYGYNGYITLAAKNVYGDTIKVFSDVRSKRNISLAPYGIKDFRKFNIYNFSLKYDKDHLKNIGVIAQEYRKAFPLAIVKGGKYLSIQPDWLYYSMINAVKDLNKLVQEFQVKLDEYVNNFESIKSRISTLEQSVAEEKQNNANMRKELEQINAQLLAKTKNNNKL